MHRVALIADVGESFGTYTIGDDERLLGIVTDANVACGFHAGDPRVMAATVERCAAEGVSVGAHPGFNDLAGFGRRAIALSAEEVRTDVLYQLGAIAAFARAAGEPLRHVTVHGKLDNMAGTDPVYAEAIVQAVVAFDPELVVVAQDGELEQAALRAGLRVAYTLMADRAYEDDGQPVDRSKDGAVLHDTDEIAARTIRAVRDGVLTSISGNDIAMPCDAVLVHGDTPEAVANARALRSALESAGVELAPLGTVLAR